MASGKTLQSTIEISGVLSPSLQAAINNAVGRLSDMAEETLESADAATRLVAEMNAQEDVLKNLQKAYAGYVANGEEGSEQAQDLANRIRDVSGELEDNRATLQAAEKAAQRLTDSQEDAADTYTKLERKINSQQDELESLRREYANVVLEQGKGSKEARQLANKISDLSGELSKNEKKLNESEKIVDRWGRSLDDAGDKAEKSADGFTVMTGALANLTAKGIEVAVEGLKDLASAAYESYQEYDAGADTIIAKTGATGEAAEDLQNVYKNVSQSVVGDFGDIGTAVGEINTRFGLTGDDLESLSTKFVKFAELNETDVNDAVDNVQKSMEAFGLDASEAGNVLDTLNKVGQDTGINMEDLTTMLYENASSFSQMGLDVHQAASFLGDVEKSGVATSTAMTALSKASQYAAEENKPLTQILEETTKKMQNAKTDAEGLQVAYDVFGKKAGAKIYEACKNGSLSFEDLTAAMENNAGSIDKTYEATQDGMDKINLAVQGAKAEVGDTLAGFFDDHKDEIVAGIETVKDGIQTSIEWLSENVPPAVEWVKNNIPTITVILAGLAAAVVAFKWASIVDGIKKVGAAFKAFGALLASNPIGLIIIAVTALVAAFVYLWQNCEGFRNFWINLWEKIKTAASAAGEWIKNALTGLKDKFMSIWTAVTSFLSTAWTTIKNVVKVGIMFVGQIISGAFQLITLPFRFIWENCKDTIMNVWNTIKEKVSTALNAIKNVISNVWNAIKGFLEPIVSAIANFVTEKWENLKEKVSNVFNSIKSIATTVWNTIKTSISNVVNGIKNTVSSVFDSVKSKVSGVFNSIKSIASSVWNSIKNAISTPINAAKDAVKAAIDKIKGFFNFNWSLPKLKLPHFSIDGKFSLNPPSVPKLSIDWYKDGGILTQPTIFGAAGDKLLAGGEAGAEAVLPLAVLWDKMESMLHNAFNSATFTGEISEEGLTSKAGELLTLDNFSLGSLANGTNVVYYYDFSNFTWSPEIHTEGSKDGDDFMAQLKAHEAEFFDWLEEFIKMREVSQYA